MTQRRHRRFAGFPKPALLAAGLVFLACDGGNGAGSARCVTLTGRNDGGVPGPLAWVAYQDGDGPWKSLPGAGGVYEFEAPSGRYQLAFVCAAPGIMRGEVIAATVDELAQIDIPCPSPDARIMRAPWRATIKNAPGGAVGVVFGSKEGGAWPAAVSADGKTFAADLPHGTYDLLAAIPDSGQMVVKRDVAIFEAGKTEIDFAAGTVTPKLQRLPLLALGPQDVVESGSFFTSARGARIDLRAERGSVALLDPADLAPGDIQQVYLEARANEGEFRGVFHAVAGGPLPPMALPPRLTGAAASVVPSMVPFVRPRITFDVYPNAVFYQADLFTDLPNTYSWVMNVGAGWLAGQNAFELPALSLIVGFDLGWGLPTNRAVAVAVTAVASPRGFGPALQDAPPTGSGLVVSYGKKMLTLAPPP